MQPSFDVRPADFAPITLATVTPMALVDKYRKIAQQANIKANQ
jgi:hypothetical protein